MNRTRSRPRFPVLLYAVSALAVIALSFWAPFRLPWELVLAKGLGLGLVAVGMALAAWAAVSLGPAIAAGSDSRPDWLARGGPYRRIRHPVYLGTTLALIGTSLALRSLAGLLTTFILFLPCAILRAKAEERALASRFGETWWAYTRRTRFFFPGPGRS